MRATFLTNAISNLKRSATRFKRDTRGNVQIMLALTAAPLFGAAGIALDYNRTVDAMVQIQDLADRTVLFGASLDDTEAKQTEAANLFLNQNEIPFSGVTYAATVSHGVDSVAVVVTTSVNGTLTGSFLEAMNKDRHNSNLKPTIRARAKYIRGADKLVCVLALNPSSDQSISAQAFHLQGNGGFEAKGCGVHSDSTHTTQSIYMNGGGVADASFFHTVGGWSQAGSSGVFKIDGVLGSPEGNKTTFGDPFASTITPDCAGRSGSNANASNGTSAAAPTQLTSAAYNNITIGSNRATRLTQKTVYVFGTIAIHGELLATDTTIVLCGANAKIEMGAQGILKIQAPSTGGAHNGYAVVAENSTTQPSSLRGGAGTYIRGIWYTPKAGLDIGGNGEFNGSSAYFPVIVDEFKVSGTGKVNIGVDFEAYGYVKPTQLVKVGEDQIYLTKFEETTTP